jgi:hypothetical protein
MYCTLMNHRLAGIPRCQSHLLANTLLNVHLSRHTYLLAAQLKVGCRVPNTVVSIKQEEASLLTA